ncbi:MAG: ABC transporter permease, partial [Nodosilinea sp.]
MSSLSLPRRPTRQKLTMPRSLQGWLLPLALGLLWEALSRFGVVAPNLLPAPTTVLQTILDMARSGELFRHVG